VKSLGDGGTAAGSALPKHLFYACALDSNTRLGHGEATLTTRVAGSECRPRAPPLLFRSPNRSTFPMICLLAGFHASASVPCLNAQSNPCACEPFKGRVCDAGAGNIWNHLRAWEGWQSLSCPVPTWPPSPGPPACVCVAWGQVY
jgi:hypothetical protein